MLYRISLPLNLYRTVLLLAMCACCIVGLTVFPAFFWGKGIRPSISLRVCISSSSSCSASPVTDLTTLAYDKWQEGKRARGRAV